MITSARRVSLKVEIDGHDATGWLDPSLIDLTYTDHAGGKADEVQLTLHDRDGSWRNDWMPRKGMAVDVGIVCRHWFAEGEDYELPCGQFRIDEVEYKGPPATVGIKAVSASLTGGLRDEARTRGWEHKGLKALAGEIAKSHDLTLVWQGTDVTLGRVDQRNESDLAFIDRLATDRGMLCKVHDGKLAIYSRDGAEGQKADITVKPAAFDGEPMTTLVPQSWSFKEKSSGTGYNQARVSYTNPVTGKVSMVQLKRKDGTNAYGLTPPPGTDKTLTSQQRAESPQDAAALAHGQLQRKNQNEATCTLDFMGDPRLVAGKVVQMAGFGKFSGPYLVKKATHKVSATGGYTTSLDLTRCGPGWCAWAVTATDEALAKPARTMPAVLVRPVDQLVGNVDVWAAGASYLRDFIALAKHDDASSGTDGEPVKKTAQDIIPCLSRIAAEIAAGFGKGENWQGWLYLSQMLDLWLATPAARPGEPDEVTGKDDKERLENRRALEASRDVFPISWDWAWSFLRVRNAYAHLMDRGRLLSDKAKAVLQGFLRSRGCFEGNGKKFDLIAEYVANWRQWEKQSHQYQEFVWFGFPFPTFSARDGFVPDGLDASMANCTLRALAAGYTVKAEHGFVVVIERVGAFVQDDFNFGYSTDKEEDDQSYRFWNCEKLDFDYFENDEHVELHNSDFREFRRIHKKGGDFLVLSDVHEVVLNNPFTFEVKKDFLEKQ